MDEATRISLKDQFNSLLVHAIEGRRGGMALMRVLEELDFYNSPASAKHHLNVPGGLVLHSLNVARAALELCDKMPQFAKCNKGAVLTAALLHDVCKAGQYIKKPDGSYRYEDSHLMGHGEAYPTSNHENTSFLFRDAPGINVGKMGRGRFDRCDPAGASGSVFRRGRRAELPDRRGGARPSGDVLSPIPGAGSGQRALRRLR